MSSFISVTCVTCCFPFQYEPTAAIMLLFRNRSPPPHSRLVSLMKSGVIHLVSYDMSSSMYFAIASARLGYVLCLSNICSITGCLP